MPRKKGRAKQGTPSVRHHGVGFHLAPRRYRPEVRHLRSTHSGRAGQKGGWLWLGHLARMALPVLTKMIAPAVQIGAQVAAGAATGAIQTQQQEEANKRALAAQAQQARDMGYG